MNTLYRQLQVAGPNEKIYHDSVSPRIEYDQIFRSPWCCDVSQEVQYRSMMESLASLNMDDTECTLLLLAAVFDTSGTHFSSCISSIFPYLNFAPERSEGGKKDPKGKQIFVLNYIQFKIRPLCISSSCL